MDSRTISYYSKNAELVVDRYESIVNGLAEHFEVAFPSGSRVLDIGCGSGRDLAYLQTLECDVYGLDATPELVELAQSRHPELKGRIVCESIPSAQVPFGGAFDGVLCSAVLMHIPLEHQIAAAEFIERSLKPGGRLLYSVPSKRRDATTTENRDGHGRLFIPDLVEGYIDILVNQGFTLIERWCNADSLGRDEVEWASVLMQLRA
ncbi:class I SAM-dependent methyltransferase [Paraburkholderia acidiphila]|uniref:Methyltransferase domain-containing protein n=1 Tax=Paraburkholderia acidiphila TaxID=2571747 RepID=A0A7Z2G9Z5_9BURK|nr:class I SAM-dependent methyltransferase [Paraburkholderia acidiphila]QGZ57734.1 methyltransferase domain-containing protein [Paraburkholderia acidiphila]